MHWWTVARIPKFFVRKDSQSRMLRKGTPLLNTTHGIEGSNHKTADC